MENPAAELVGVTFTGRMLQRSTTSIYALEKSGILLPVRTAEGRRLYRLEQVRKLAKEYEAQSNDK